MKPDPLDKIPVHDWDGLQYVLLDDIPEPARSAFDRSLYGAQMPAVPGVGKCKAAYVWDWTLFLGRWRRSN